jgi:hypothetical protein
MCVINIRPCVIKFFLCVVTAIPKTAIPKTAIPKTAIPKTPIPQRITI